MPPLFVIIMELYIQAADSYLFIFSVPATGLKMPDKSKKIQRTNSKSQIISMWQKKRLIHLTTEAAIAMNDRTGHVAIAEGKYDSISNFFRFSRPASRNVIGELLKRVLFDVLRYKIPPGRIYHTGGNRIDA